MLNLVRQANPSGRTGAKRPGHAQSIAGDHSFGDYNPAKSHRHPIRNNRRVKRYAELAGNRKNLRIKSHRDNKTSQIAEKTIRDKLSTAIYNVGTDAKQIQGLRLLLSASNTYGGIDQSTYTWWQAQVDSTTTTLTLSAMQSMFGDCGEGTEYPNLIIGDQDMFDRYHALLTPQQRFADEDTAKGGFKSLMYAGAPVVVDASAPAGDMMFLNLDYLDLYPHKDENFRMEPSMVGGLAA